MDTARIKEAALGQFGFTYESGTTAVAGTYWMLKVITEATFSALTITDAGGDTITGVAFPVGTEIMGKITAFTLTTGSVIAYKAPN